MFRRYYPYARVTGVFAIDYKKLYEDGFRGIIFDIDNTLVHNGDDSTPEVDALFEKLCEIGFSTVLLSNNTEERILRFIKNIDVPYIHEADKPQPDGFKKALELLGTASDKTLCIGDQIFTDIYGANKCDIPSILVDYIRVPYERKKGIKRRIEEILLFFYKMNRQCYNRLGNINITEECP